jgi:hypothetical protein
MTCALLQQSPTVRIGGEKGRCASQMDRKLGRMGPSPHQTMTLRQSDFLDQELPT